MFRRTRIMPCVEYTLSGGEKLYVDDNNILRFRTCPNDPLYYGFRWFSPRRVFGSTPFRTMNEITPKPRTGEFLVYGYKFLGPLFCSEESIQSIEEVELVF